MKHKLNSVPGSGPLLCEPISFKIQVLLVVFLLSTANGICANSPIYPSVVKGDGALGYYRFNDSLTRTLINANSGSLGSSGNASNDLASVFNGVVYSMPGAVVGDSDRAAYFDFTTRTEIPFNAALNIPNTQPFTVESWIYPVSDQVGTGMGVWCNRYTQGATRQGWVMYQRAPDTNHCTTCGPGVGWEFRMYNNLDGSGHLDVTSGVPFQLGKWQYVAVVYEPIGGDVTNATVSIYIDGVLANIDYNNTNSGTFEPGYYPCQNTNAVQPNGPPAMSVGGYNNANGGTAGFENPWIGGIDEFAWYSNKLSAAQIMAHYQNGTNAARTTPYATLIKSDNPVAYLRLDEVAPGPDTSFNIGDSRSAGHATNGLAVKHPGTSALSGRTDDGSFSGKPQYSLPRGQGLADIPWTAANNPDASVPFTIEAWFRPKSDYTRNGPSPMNNRLAQGVGYTSSANRTGWVMYQRDPDASYATNTPNAGESGVGWALRMYQGNGTGGNDVITGGSGITGGWGYNVGEWMHVVFTWEPQTDNGTTTSLSEQWSGILTAYTNGVAANTNLSCPYAANVNPTFEGRPPADLAIGMYNLASQGSDFEEFDGDVDEFAFYNNYVLTAAQILAHYQAGTNAHPATNYETLVFTAAGDSYLANVGPPINERTTIPQTYLRFNEPAYFPAANSGSLGYLADGSLVLTTNNVTGPVSAGFEGSNTSAPFDGVQSWVSLNNPAGLKISGQITLEAWIKPSATQSNIARIVSHGPPTPTAYDPSVYTFDLSGTLLSSNQVFLRLEGGGATYSVGSSDGTTFHGATAPVPAGVLGGGQWVYLAGTYDGSHWNLYTNGVPAKSVADATGALPVNAEWAIGSTGDGWPEVDDANTAEGPLEFFAGSIDEVAIYNIALSPAIIAAHYFVGQNGPVSLTIVHNANGTVTVTWPAGVLQQADSVTGPYSNVLVTGNPATSPYNTATGTKKFYRASM
jgi:hypothetical protein